MDAFESETLLLLMLAVPALVALAAGAFIGLLMLLDRTGVVLPMEGHDGAATGQNPDPDTVVASLKAAIATQSASRSAAQDQRGMGA